MSVLPQSDRAAAQRWKSQRRQLVLESIFVVLLTSAAFMLRIWSLKKMHFWDETVYLQNAEVICCGKTNYSELDSRPPLLSLIFAMAFLLWHHVYAACLATALLNALGPALLYFSGRIIVGRIPAAIASLLLACLPFLVDSGNSLLSDSPTLTLILLSFWFLLHALRTQADLGFASAGFFLALTVLMRFASLSTVGLLSLLLFAANRWWRAALACAVGFVATIGPYFCWSRLRYGGFFRTLCNGWASFGGPEESPFFYLKNFPVVFSWITFAGLALWIGRWARESWSCLSLHERTGEERSPKLEAFLWVWAGALLLFFSALGHKEARYLIPLAPPLFLLAGSGLTVLLRGRQTAVRVAGTLFLVGALTCAFLPLRQRLKWPFVNHEVSDEMQVSDFLNHNVSRGTALYSTFNYPVFAYYTNLPVHPLEESGSALYEALNCLPNDGILIAFKDSEVNAEPRLEWLASNPHFRRLREFSSLVLYEYRANTSR